jgi:hypothetical protein
MNNESSEALLTQINSRLSSPQFAGWILFGGLALSISVGFVNKGFAVLVLLSFVVAFQYARKADRKRRTFIMPYNLPEITDRRWEKLNDALLILAESQRLWLVNGIYSTFNSKRNAGSSQIVSRLAATIGKSAPPFIETNIKPLCLTLGGQDNGQSCYFLPDVILIYQSQSRKYSAVSYDNVKLDSGITQFTETDALPSDSYQLGQTWLNVNMDGSPDRRFKYNRQVPIVQYGVFNMSLNPDLVFTLYVSSSQKAELAVAKFQPNGHTSKPNGEYRKREERQGAYSKSQQQRRSSPPRPPRPEPISDCYTVLGLSQSCTQEEASTIYRKLAKQYHPDMVTHLAPEFREMAEQKMKSFNEAYSDLKRQRGW